jgi:hypothetical protein
MSDLHWMRAMAALVLFPGQVGQAGLHWTVEVAIERETPSHLAAAGGILALLCPIENAAANVTGQSSWLRCGGVFLYSSQRPLVGVGVATDTIRLSRGPLGIEPQLKPFCQENKKCKGINEGTKRLLRIGGDSAKSAFSIFNFEWGKSARVRRNDEIRFVSSWLSGSFSSALKSTGFRANGNTFRIRQ